jgi:4-hydroxy-tetrahydrodipicolinate synthase
MPIHQPLIARTKGDVCGNCPRGVVVSLNTPFDELGRIDFRSLERLLEFHLSEDVGGFLVPAQAAEVLSLTPEERISIVTMVREVTRGRTVVIAGATAASVQESLTMAQHAVQIGCEGVLSEPPIGMPLEFEPLLGYFEEVARIGPPFLMIQDLDWRGSGMPIELIGRLFEALPTFRCIKIEVKLAGPKYSAVLSATDGRLRVAGGWAALQMIEALDRGVDTFMNTAMARFYRAVIDAYGSGDRTLAIQQFRDILPVLAFTRQHLDISIAFHKRLFHHLNIFASAYVRKPSVRWDSFHERQCADLLSYIDGLYESTTLI